MDTFAFRSVGQWLHTGGCEAQGKQALTVGAGMSSKGKVAQEIPVSLKR